jgi:hypothetical protein
MSYLNSAVTNIVYPIIGFLFALALVYFLWGVVKFIWNWGNPADREAGQKHMLWGVIGMAIMLSAFGIMYFIFTSVVVNTGYGGSVPTPPAVNGSLQVQ